MSHSHELETIAYRTARVAIDVVVKGGCNLV